MTELEKNIKAYHEMEAELIANHPGKVALFANGKFVTSFSDVVDAYKAGMLAYGEGKFSTKEIGAPAESLGVLSFLVGQQTRPTTSA